MRLATKRSWRHGVLVLLWPALVMGQPATDAETRTVHHDLRRGSIFSLGAEAVLASEPEAGGS